MTKLECNGWTNWYTWMVRCHCLDEIIEGIERPDEFTQQDLRDAVEEYAFTGDPSSIALELLRDALHTEVNWDELYNAMKDVQNG